MVLNMPGGSTVTVPFSNYCTTLHAVGLAGNGITMLIGLMVVFGGSSSRKD